MADIQAVAAELAAAIDALGNGLFGSPENGKSWRDAKAEWWQRCKAAVEAYESLTKAIDGAAINAVSVLMPKCQECGKPQLTLNADVCVGHIHVVDTTRPDFTQIVISSLPVQTTWDENLQRLLQDAH